MIRNLLVISGIALLAAIACFGGAAIVASKDIQEKGGWSWYWHPQNQQWNYNYNNGHLSVSKHSDTPALSAEETEVITRNLDWDGASGLELSIPAHVTYVQGPQNSVTVSGPKYVLDKLRITDGRIYFDTDTRTKMSFGWQNGHLKVNTDDLKITVTAPNVNRFAISGAGEVKVTNYDQPELTLNISGAGDIDASGRTDAVKLSISGAGEADLEHLATRDANISVSGKGDTTLSATGNVNVSVSGMGDVTLKTKPASLSTQISGMGKVKQP